VICGTVPTEHLLALYSAKIPFKNSPLKVPTSNPTQIHMKTP
jgi:hypothetical protein